MGMEFRTLRSDLYTAVARTTSIAGKKVSLPILYNVLLETVGDGVRITATDLEVGLQTVVPAEVLSPGSITLPARKLFEIIRESNADTLTFIEGDNLWMRIEAGSGRYNIAGTDAAEFPEFPSFDEEALLALPADVLQDCIDKTLFCVVEQGASQFNIAGALLDIVADKENTLRIVASDGHRLALMERDCGVDLAGLRREEAVIFPRKGMAELAKLCQGCETILLGVDDRQVVAKSDDTVMVFTLLNGQYPRYDKFLSFDRSVPVTINRVELQNALRRMSLFTEDEFHTVNFNLTGNTLTLTSQNADLGNATEKIPISYTGDDLSLYFNGKYFTDCLGVLSGEEVELFPSDTESPCYVTSPEEPGFVGVIMPMKF